MFKGNWYQPVSISACSQGIFCLEMRNWLSFFIYLLSAFIEEPVRLDTVEASKTSIWNNIIVRKSTGIKRIWHGMYELLPKYFIIYNGF